MINAWDFYYTYIAYNYIDICESYYPKQIFNWENVRPWLLSGLALVVFAILLVLPAIIQFQSPVMGIGFSPLYVSTHSLKDVQYPTPLSAF